jgi:formate dehydrogenase subunit beta
MNSSMKEKARQLLEEGKVSGFLGLMGNGHPAPHLFTRDNMEDLESLVVGSVRYPLNKLLMHVVRKYPEDTFAVMVRGCDERGLIELFKWNQLDPEKIIMAGVACPQELAEACECKRPYPQEFVSGEQVRGIEDSQRVKAIEALGQEERLSYWLAQFEKCIKCYGCRDVCPMCFCNDCTLEDPHLVSSADLPPESPIFHMTRAIHMAGRCIDCGLCDEVCPSNIPVRTLYKKVASIVSELFGYQTGDMTAGKSPFNILGKEPSQLLWWRLR